MYQNNQQLQFAGLLKENRPLVYSVINEYCQHDSDKDDLYQDICIRAWEAFGGFSGRSRFSTWLHSVAKYTAIDRHRRVNKQTGLKTILTDNFFWEIEDIPYTEEPPPPIDLSVIEKLSSVEKQTLQMRIDGLTFSEISKQTGEPMNRLIIRMHRIKKLLTDGTKRRYIPVSERKQKTNEKRTHTRWAIH